MAKKSKNTKRVLEQVKAQRGLDRKQYFEEGGEMARWRGPHLVQRENELVADRRLSLVKTNLFSQSNRTRGYFLLGTLTQPRILFCTRFVLFFLLIIREGWAFPGMISVLGS